MSLPTIRLLVEMWPELIKQITGDGYHGFGCLPLHLALKSSEANVGLERAEVSLEIIQFLVEQWPESLQKECNGHDDALMIALCNGHTDHIIQYLLQQWPDSIKKCYYGVTALHCTCEHGRSIPLIQSLWPDSVKQCNEDGATVVHCACGHGWSLPLIQFLAEQWPEAVKIKKKGYYGGILLMLALHEKKTPVETIAFLIDMWPESVKEKDPYHDETCLLIALKNQIIPNSEIISFVD